LEGADVGAIEIPAGSGSSRPAAKSPRPGATPAPAAAPAAGPGFTKDVVPVLVRNCGGCHVTGRRGEFQMASYDGLMRTGMVQKGEGNASRLVEVILSGDMPRGGGKVSPADLATLIKWIDAGAAFDGPDPAAPLASGPRPPAAPPPPVRGAVALEPGDVSFAFEVAPVLLQHCAGCHDADDPEGGLRMVSLESLVRGGQTGPAVVPGKSADSLLVKKVRGTGIDGQQMPLGKPPLPTDTIEIIAKWIDQGIKLDLLTPKSPLADIAAAGRARSLSHDDLAKARFAAADGVWRRAIPEEPVVVERAGRVCVVSNLPASRVEELASTADRIEGLIRRELVADDTPLVKGGVVLLAFAKAYDYSDFWVNVLGEERPKGLLGGPGASGDVVYGALVMPDAGQTAADTDFRIAEQLTAAALIGRNAPAWFAMGAARVTAAKVVPKAALAKSWRSDATDRIAHVRSATDLVGGRGDPADTAAVAAAFFGASGGATKLPALVEKLDDGVAFDTAFQQVFRGPPAAVVDGWLARENRKPARRGSN
jgi:mono/diheme cytochrome c family protein